MFHFFRSRRAKSKLHSRLSLYELNERETDLLMGGSPVRQLISARHQAPAWMRTFDGTHAPAMTVAPPSTGWQPTPTWATPTWVHVGEEPARNWFSYPGE